MIHRDDIWKLVTVIGAVLSAIAAHAVKLPPTWEWFMPYAEFASGVTAVVMAVLIRPRPTGDTE